MFYGGGVSGRYLTSFLDLTKNVGLSEGLFSGRLRHSREQKISNFGLRRPKNSRNLEKAEKLSKMSCFVMAFSGVLEKNQAYRSQKSPAALFGANIYKKAPQPRKNRVFSHFFWDFRGPGSDKKSRIFKPPRFAHFLGLELYFKLESGVKIRRF